VKWNKEKLLALLPMAEAVRSLSKDSNTKIGALIIDEDYTIRSTGYNGLSRGIDESPPERHSRINGEKYFWYEHAERNAIYNAIRIHADIRNCYMLLTCDIPCCDCARAIIQTMHKGIILVSTENKPSNQTLWQEHAKRSRMMFEETYKEIIYISDLK
jgi:dCMP deaminase